MSELSDSEKKFIQLYKNYKTYYNDPIVKQQHDKWTKDGTKEKTWIRIYTKLPIESHIESLLFNSSYNEDSVLTEMEQYIQKNLTM
jgi:hypothetical protein